MLLDEMLNYNLYKKMYGGELSQELLFRSKRLLEGNYLLKKYDDINDIMLKKEEQEERKEQEIIEQIKKDYDRQKIYINGTRIQVKDVDNTIKNGVGNINNIQMLNLLNLCMQGVLGNFTEIIIAYIINYYDIKKFQLAFPHAETFVDIRIKGDNIKYKLTRIITVNKLEEKIFYLGYNQFFEIGRAHV